MLSRYNLVDPFDESLTPIKSFEPSDSKIKVRNININTNDIYDTPTSKLAIVTARSSMIPSILGTGSSFSEMKYSTDEMIAAFHHQRKVAGDTEYDHKFVDKVFTSCQFKEHSVCLPKEKLFSLFTREEYIDHRRCNLKNLALKAARDAILNWGGDITHITHLLWGTMTGGMDSPSLDIRLTLELGLNTSVKRTNIEGMGCLTGFRLLNLAREISLGNPSARILVVSADLRSALGNSLPPSVSRADIVSCSLFRDAGSAAIVGSYLQSNEHASYEMISGASKILPNSFDYVMYQELNDSSIQLHLSRDLPSVVCEHDGDFCQQLHKEAQIYLDTIRVEGESQDNLIPNVSEMDILCHTGGPKILSMVAQSLNIDNNGHMKASWNVMTRNGNLSGASNLAVLHEQLQLTDHRPWALCISMGPGMCLEGLILRRVVL